MGWTLLVLAMVGYLVWLRKNKNQQPVIRRQVVRHGPQDNRYHAVVIKTKGRGCAEIQAFKGKPFLAADAPALPLQDCSAATCGCRYRHLADRRQDQRRSAFGQTSLSYEVTGRDRRSGTDRRRPAAAL